MKKNLLFIFLLVVVSSCKKETLSEFNDSPIIEGYILPGGGLKVKIIRQTPFDDNVIYSDDDINNLEVRVLINGSEYLMLPTGNGYYACNSVLVQDGDEFTLRFVYNSKNVSAYTYIPAKPEEFAQSVTEIEIERMDTTMGPPSMVQPDPIEMSWKNFDNSYYLIVVENIESVLDPIRDFGDNGPPTNTFRKSPTQNSSEELRSMEFSYYGTHRIVLYHVLPDYASLYDESSTSSQNITNPSTSIVNGYGIFTGLSSDTLYVIVKEP